jgi:hypothetical protein
MTPEIKIDNPKPKTEQSLPDSKLRDEFGKAILESEGIKLTLEEIIQIDDHKYAKQIIKALGFAQMEYLKDANTPKVIDRIDLGNNRYQEQQITPLITILNEQPNSPPRLMLCKIAGAKPHEYRKARESQLKLANEIMILFEKPTLDLKLPTELPQLK